MRPYQAAAYHVNKMCPRIDTNINRPRNAMPTNGLVGRLRGMDGPRGHNVRRVVISEQENMRIHTHDNSHCLLIWSPWAELPARPGQYLFLVHITPNRNEARRTSACMVRILIDSGNIHLHAVVITNY